MKILITAIGKRVELIEALSKDNYIIGIDSNDANEVAAATYVNEFIKVPKCNQDNYINEIMDICKKVRVDAIIPLYEPEFYRLAKNEKEFAQVGTKLILSDKNVLDICQNKLNTAKFFIECGLKTPKVYREFPEHFPVIIKPVDGMGSTGIYKAYDKEDYSYYSKKSSNSIVCELVDGDEYTIDVLCDLKGNVISIVPRIRLEVRAGEVVKSATLASNTKLGMNMIEQTKLIMRELNKRGKAIGPFTLQAFDTKDGISWIEINARFGGGVTLSIFAGVDYSYFIDRIAAGKKCTSIIGNYKSLKMLRYDNSRVVEN